MGFLDDLRREAEQRRNEEASVAAQRAAREAFYRSDILPRMEAAYRLFAQLAEHLNYLRPEQPVNYTLRGYGEWRGLRQENYELQVDSRQNMRQLVLRAECRGEEELVFTVEGHKAIQRQVDYLNGTGLSFHYRERRDERMNAEAAEFIVKPLVPVSLTMEADIEEGRIVIALRNFEDFGSRRYFLEPRKLDEAVLDQLARYVARDSDRFLQDDVDAQTRAALQAKLREEAAQRQRELAESEARARAAESAAAGRKSLLGGLLKKGD